MESVSIDNQMWYLTACSKGILINRKKGEPLDTGIQSREKGIMADRPMQYAALPTLVTLLKQCSIGSID